MEWKSITTGMFDFDLVNFSFLHTHSLFFLGPHTLGAQDAQETLTVVPVGLRASQNPRTVINVLK